jgi:putative membrane protein
MKVGDKINKTLGPEGLQRIENAVRKAESGTSGKLTVYLAWQSDDYPEAIVRGAGLAVVFACLAIYAADFVHPLWLPVYLILISILAAAAAGALAGKFLTPLRRLLIGSHRMDAMVHRHAKEVFLDKKMFRTREHNGILIFVSLFEKRTVVIADAGIHGKVSQQDWDQAVAHVTDNARIGGLATGIANAVGHCHELLLRAGFKNAGRPADEREDKPIIEGNAS